MSGWRNGKAEGWQEHSVVDSDSEQRHVTEFHDVVIIINPWSV